MSSYCAVSSTKNDPDFCSNNEDYPESFYYNIQNRSSTPPFQIDIGNDETIYYYLKRNDTDSNINSNIKNIVGKMHNCRCCMERCEKQCLLFGPNGYAVDFDNGGPLYNQINDIRNNIKNVDKTGVFIVSQNELDKNPRKSGKDSITGIEWLHLGLNVEDTFITHHNISRKIPSHMTNAVWNDTLDGNLEEILGNMRSDLPIIKRVMQRDNVLRKESFWNHRIDTVEKIQNFADQFPNSNNWSRMSEIDKIHVRMFAIFNGGPNQWTNQGHNILFMAARRVIDVSKNGYNEQSLPGLMNEMSSPENHMRQQIDKAREEHNATDKFNASVGWNDKSDIDIVGVNMTTQEICYYGKMDVGGMKLRFDANASSVRAVSNPVEDLAFVKPGRYAVYINLYRSIGGAKVPFTVYIGDNGSITEYKDVWDTSIRGTNTTYSIYGLNKMMFITNVTITPEMFNSNDTELSDKQLNKLSAAMPKFQEAFCPLTTHIANEEDLINNVALTPPKPKVQDSETLMDDFSSLLNDRKKKKQRQTLSDKCSVSLSNISDIITYIQQGNNVTMTVEGMSFPPTLATIHNRMDNLKESVCLSTYYKYGMSPMQPDPSLTSQCRFGDEWSSSPDELVVTNITPISHSSGSYKGFFLSLANVHLPDINERWVNGAGMYVSDLKNDFHEVRGIWGSHHSSVRPTDGNCGIGIYIFEKTTFQAKINGVVKTISA